MKEYETLRTEILDRMNAIVQYNMLLYTVTVAVLAFAFEKESPFLFLVPYVAIITIHLLTEEERKKTARISSYMIVFLENLKDSEYHWESRFYKRTVAYAKKHAILSFNIPVHTPHLFIAFVCSGCSIWKAVLSDTTNFEKWASIMFVVLLTVFTVVFMIRIIRYNSRIKTTYIKEWQAIKDAEEQEARKRNANRNPQ